MLGTVRRHLRFVPDKMRCVGKRELYSTDFRFSEADRTALMLYVAKKSKPVLILSTLHNNTAVSDTQTKKPLAILDYNTTKGGVDAADERIGTYSVKYITRRWHAVVFCNIVDCSAFDAFILHQQYDPDWSKRTWRRRMFLKELAHLLTEPYRQRRLQASAPAAACAAAARLGLSTQPTILKSASATRCVLCDRRKDRKVKQVYACCQRNVCKDHSCVICDKCVVSK